MFDERDEIEIEFDERFLDEEVDVSEDDSDSDDIEMDTDEADEIGDLRIKNKSYKKTITKAEAEEIKAKIEEKTRELEEARIGMQEKREDGDLSENEAYHYLKDKVSGLEFDIVKLQEELKCSIIRDVAGSSDSIGKGSKIHLTITSVSGVMEPEDITIEIVSEGHSGLNETTGVVKVPENSEVYRKISGKKSGEFTLTGTDGNNYKYVFKLLEG